jgi:hypothetical protein
MTRPLVPEERQILNFLLTKGFLGRDQLLTQLGHVRVAGPSCSCGCDSVGLIVDETVPPAPVQERVPTEAFGRDSRGSVVGVLLHVVDGYMVDLEFYSADADQFGRPTLDSLELADWSERDASGTRILRKDLPPADGKN